MSESRENPYRYGVLIGNFDEERFGLELAQQARGTVPSMPTSKLFHAKHSTMHNAEPPSRDYSSMYKWDPRGMDKHQLFGHGLDEAQFDKSDYRTSYELAYANKVPAHKTIESKFVPPPAVEPVKDPEPDYSRAAWKPKSYNDYTKSCDATFNKIGLRK